MCETSDIWPAAWTLIAINVQTSFTSLDEIIKLRDQWGHCVLIKREKCQENEESPDSSSGSKRTFQITDRKHGSMLKAETKHTNSPFGLYMNRVLHKTERDDALRISTSLPSLLRGSSLIVLFLNVSFSSSHNNKLFRTIKEWQTKPHLSVRASQKQSSHILTGTVALGGKDIWHISQACDVWPVHVNDCG